MAIKALPEATSQLLGSSQVLTTPVSLVKELIDNAIDARATSVDVAISTNTLDKIEVRDNGHGIPPEDFDALGRRGYTSKLRNFHEVRIIGGLTLGFRGEALASATELGNVSITTRTDGEAVAAGIKLKARGGVESQSSISHPIGTTVCVTNFFSKLPVRKQNALKEAKKTLANLKDLLQSYTLARLDVRFSLKVLKLAKSNWSFAPSAKDGIKEIVSQVIGRDIAAQCTETSITLPLQLKTTAPLTGTDGEEVEAMFCSAQSEFIMQAFLAKPDADFGRIDGGQYMSIDSRPVSPTRGTAKKIITMYKAAIRAAAADITSGKVKNPFIRLNIVCPRGSYDPNIDPAKDNVLFEDESLVLSLAEQCFRNIYVSRPTIRSKLEQRPEEQADQDDTVISARSVNHELRGEDIPASAEANDERLHEECVEDLCSETLAAPASTPQCDDDAPRRMIFSVNPEDTGFTEIMSEIKSRFDMSKEFDEESQLDERDKMSDCCPATAQFEPMDCRETLNPWTIAKLNAPVTRNQERDRVPRSAPPNINNKGTMPVYLKPPTREVLISRLSPAGDYQPSREAPSSRLATEASTSQSLLESWLKQNCVDHSNQSESSSSAVFPIPADSDNLEALVGKQGIVTARKMLRDMPWSPPPTQEHLEPKRPRGINKPYVHPLTNTLGKNTQPTVTQNLRTNGIATQATKHNEHTSDTVFDLEMYRDQDSIVHHNEVHDALDFERRKEVATSKLRDELRRSQSRVEILNILKQRGPKSSRQICHNAILGEVDAHQTPSRSDIVTEKIPASTCLPDGDPRAYFMRRQKSVAAFLERPGIAPKLKRAKTTLLPLETIPSHAEIHNLVHIVKTNIDFIGKSLQGLAAHGGYVENGSQLLDLDMLAKDLSLTKKSLESIASRWLHIAGGEQHDPQLHLGGYGEGA